MERVFERRTLTATLIFNLEDSYARARLGPRAHPRPYEPLRFFLVARLAPGPREDFSPREMAITRNPSGYHLFFGEELLPPGPRDRGNGRQRATRRLDLAPGTYLVRITSPLYQTEERPVAVPMPNLNASDPGSPDPALRDPVAQYTFAMRPGYAYPFPDRYPLRVDDPDVCPYAPAGRRGPTLLFGSLSTPDGRGRAGATVRVQGLTESYRTDASGQWVLWFPDPPLTGADPLASGIIAVRFTLPDDPPRDVDVPGVCVVRGCSTRLAQASLRGWVLRRGAGVAGATVAVSGQSATTTTGSDGGWTYCFDLNQPDATVAVTATLPDGASQTQNSITVRRRATALVPTFAFS
jgi:hypothetical protein